jgi:hypothetical protein
VTSLEGASGQLVHAGCFAHGPEPSASLDRPLLSREGPMLPYAEGTTGKDEPGWGGAAVVSSSTEGEARPASPGRS